MRTFIPVIGFTKVHTPAVIGHMQISEPTMLFLQSLSSVQAISASPYVSCYAIVVSRGWVYRAEPGCLKDTEAKKIEESLCGTRQPAYADELQVKSSVSSKPIQPRVGGK